MTEQQAVEHKDNVGVRVSRMSMSISNSSAGGALSKFKSNIRLMFTDRKLLKYLFHFIGLCLISFLPLIFAGIALAFSTPSSVGKAAIYMVTLAIALVSVGFSARLSYQRLCKAISGDDLQSLPVSTVEVVDSPSEAFTSSQQQYNSSNSSESNATIPPVPPLPGNISLPPVHKLPPPPPYPDSNVNSWNPSAEMSMPMPPEPQASVPAPPPLPIGNTQMPTPMHYNSSGQNKDKYVENWVNTSKVTTGDDSTNTRGQGVPSASSIDGLLETMLESFTDNSRPSTNVSKNIPPFIPLPSKMPTNNSHTMAEMPVNVQRKDSAKRKMFEALKQEKCEATADNTHGNNADDFLDSDSDNMSFEGGSPRGARQSDDLGDKWKPASINLENIAAHIVQALNQSDAPRNTLGGLHVTNNVGSRDNLPIEVHTPNISPRRAEQVTTPPTQRAVVHTRPPPLPPKQSQQRMEIESMASSMTYDD